MTFSIVGRCAETGQLGVAISSSSIAVGARCPWLRPGVGAVSTQNITLPALGPGVLDGLEQGLAPTDAVDKALTRNGYSQYRQLTAIDYLGRSVHFSGSQTLGTHHAVSGEQCVAAGNMLAAPEVITAMVRPSNRAKASSQTVYWPRCMPPSPPVAKPARCSQPRWWWWAS